jgi:hypothetical protein
MDPFTMLSLASTAMGAAQGIGAAKNRKAENNYRKAVLKYSPWTDIADPGASTSHGNALTGAISGGLTGAMLGKSLDLKGADSMFGASPKPTGLSDQVQSEGSLVEPSSGGMFGVDAGVSKPTGGGSMFGVDQSLPAAPSGGLPQSGPRIDSTPYSPYSNMQRNVASSPGGFQQDLVPDYRSISPFQRRSKYSFGGGR